MFGSQIRFKLKRYTSGFLFKLSLYKLFTNDRCNNKKCSTFNRSKICVFLVSCQKS